MGHSHPREAIEHRLPAERERRPSAQPFDALRLINDDDHPLARACDDLFTQQGPAHPFDEGERAALDLVGAVDRQVDAAMHRWPSCSIRPLEALEQQAAQTKDSFATRRRCANSDAARETILARTP